MKIGDKVHYTPAFGRIENGIIKAIGKSAFTVFVVYKCGGDWENYQNYTAASTNILDLKEGWIEEKIIQVKDDAQR